MRARYKHTNLIAKDWKNLSHFYQAIFVCKPMPPQRSQSGQWFEEGTAVAGASLAGEHLLLPGHGPHGPTLEIYQYSETLDKPDAASVHN